VGAEDAFFEGKFAARLPRLLQQKLQAIPRLANGNLSNSGLGSMLLFFKQQFYQNQPKKSTVFGVQMWCECTANPGYFTPRNLSLSRPEVAQILTST